MITELLRKQLEKQLEFIYAHLPEFIKEFVNEEALEYLDDDNYFFGFCNDFIYIQRHWHEEDEDGNLSACVQEGHVDYDDYNEWVKRVQ